MTRESLVVLGLVGLAGGLFASACGQGATPVESEVSADGAELEVSQDTSADAVAEVRQPTGPEPASAELSVAPRVIDFGEVARGATATQSLLLRNRGDEAVTVSGLWLSGDPGFSVTRDGLTHSANAVTASVGIAIEPILIEPSGAAVVEVSYRATTASPAWGLISVAPLEGGATHLAASLVANADAPCIAVSPARLDFGVRAIGQQSEAPVTLINCGEPELVIERLTLEGDGDGVFGVLTGDPGPPTLPIAIARGAHRVVPIAYRPVAVGAIGRDGHPVPDVARLLVDSNADRATVELSGRGLPGGSCPIPAIRVTEGREVFPGTRLHLDSAYSGSPNGAITGWEWSVEQPAGSVSTFLPSPFVRAPTFEANVAGTYTFKLAVFDALALEGCPPAESVVTAVSVEPAIRVELTWHTPGDPDESDTGHGAFGSVGSDLDLHFLHPHANGKYFDWTYDCFGDNTNPEWGLYGPSDNPRLDRNDTDGGGPENLTLFVPEQGLRYQVGVHYGNDWGYGFSLATVRIYIHGVLRDEWAGVRLVDGDLWDSHHIDWPSGSVTRIIEEDGGPRITPLFGLE